MSFNSSDHFSSAKRYSNNSSVECMCTYVCVEQNFHHFSIYYAAKSLQLCPTPCEPTDGSPPGSPVPGILQARTLEWVAISFSNA